MKGYNLPDNVDPNDPEATWNKEEMAEEHSCKYFEANEGDEICAWRLFTGRCARPELKLIKCEED